MSLEQFGVTGAGEPVWLARLASGPITVEILSYGATIHKILAPDRRGNYADVVLGKDDAAGYAAPGAASGAVIGRVANRIKNHSFKLNGRRHILDANENRNTLHGGSGNYAHMNFVVIEASGARVRLAARDRGDGGFPGEVTVEVCYTLSGDGTLLIEYAAVPTMDTPINLTNHVYFNLAGQGSGPADGHTLQLNAGFYTPSDAEDIPTGEIFSVKKTPFDFTKPRNLGLAMEALAASGDRHNGFDHNFVLDGEGWRKIATAADETSGRRLEAYTDLPGVQLYTANFLKDGARGKDGAE